MNLGLDLRGGVHCLMEVDMDGAIEKSLARAANEFRTYMREEKVRYRGVQNDSGKISVRFSSAENRDRSREVLEEEFRDFEFSNHSDDRSWFIDVRYNENSLVEERRSAIEQNISTLKNG